MDINLLTQIAKNYDPITKTVRNVNGRPLIEINDDKFRKVFWVSEVSNYLEPIDFEMLKKVYDAQRDHLRSGLLKELFSKIGGLTFVGTSTMETFPLNFFTLRAMGIY